MKTGEPKRGGGLTNNDYSYLFILLYLILGYKMGKQGELPIHILKQNLKSTTCNGDEHNE